MGSDVVLWGNGLPVDEVAAMASTVGYELLCAVAPRVPFVVRGTSRRRIGLVHRRHRRGRLHRIESRQGAERARRIGHHRRRRSHPRRQVPQSRRLRHRRLPRQGRVPVPHRQRRFRRRHRSRVSPGRVLGHDGDRRPVHAAQQLSLLGHAARSLPGQRHSVPVRVERVGVRRRHRVPRGARERGAAQRVRLFEGAVRPATCGACCPSAPRRSPASATSTCTARAKRTRGGWRRSRITSSTSTAPRGACGCSRARAATPTASSGAISSTSTTSSPRISTSIDIRSVAASSISAPARRRRSTRLRWRPSTRAAHASGDPARSPRRAASATARSNTCRCPPRWRGKYQSFTQADLTRLRAAGYDAPMLAVDEGVRRYVESLISASGSAS